ncbi:diaminopimelate epimerase [bacterium]|nr:diaminopimelate epimerase [bacterium]
MKNRLNFSKMHGAGNDFVVIGDMEKTFSITPGLVSALCDRRFGIGADGLILIHPSEKASFKMLYFNSDGSRAGMCGNGARCAARFAFDHSIALVSFAFETDSGIIEAEVGKREVTISLGTVTDLELNLNLGSVAPEVSFAVAGVPHALLISERAGDMPHDDFLGIARFVRYDSRFNPGGTNVNLANVVNKNSLFYRTYERGVEDETLACGTGAVAISVITSHLGMTQSPVSCNTSGGDILTVSFDKTDSGAKNCFLTGPAVESFSGDCSLDYYIKSN